MALFEIATGSTLGAVLGMRKAEIVHRFDEIVDFADVERFIDTPVKRYSSGMYMRLAFAVLIALRAEMSERLTDVFELGVAMMLVALGARAIRRASRQGSLGPSAIHQHGAIVHRHPGLSKHVHLGRWTLARRPLLVGVMHGLAGSGALTALVLATLPTSAARITYMVLFGVGSTFGMAALSGLLGWPLARLGGHARTGRAVSLAVGCLSTALGIAWGAPLLGRLIR